MLFADPGTPQDPDRHGRRAVWIAALITIVGTGLVYFDKAASDRSAFIRWRPQVLEMIDHGTNVYEKYYFPNPPIMPLTLYPLMRMPDVSGAMVWFSLKAAMAAASILMCLRMVRIGSKPIPSLAQALLVLLSIRSVMSDLTHGNNNLMILFLVTSTVYAWRKGYDVLAGLILAYAISFKVTPGLFLVYFAYKRSWRTVGTALLGLGLFLLVVPSLFLGPQFNGVCLGTWWHMILSPYVSNGKIGDPEINQSLIGVASRLLTSTTGSGEYDPKMHVNLVSWDPKRVAIGLKLFSFAFLGLLAWLCRTRYTRRDDPRLLGEFALIVMAMLFLSERSWKHHFVTMVLPYAYLSYRVAVPGLPRPDRWILGSALALSVFLMATTSPEIAKIFVKGPGEEIALAYGMFLWSSVVVFIATAWRVKVEGQIPPEEVGLGTEPSGSVLKGPYARYADLVRSDSRPGLA